MGKVHHSGCTVIPDHIMRHVAEHGDDDARETIASTLHHTRQIARERALTFMPATPAPRSGKRRAVYDASHGTILPGKLVMNELKATTQDVEAKEAFDGAGATENFYWNVFRRNSIDGRGMRLISTIHYGRNYDNAMWNGKQMVYGDGDGKLFTRFTAARDVIGHEITHGLTQFTAKLLYSDQPGALNEHISDAIGIMIKQYGLGQTADKADWYIGEGLFGPSVHGKALRSMAAPGTAYDDPVLGKDPQPAHMRDYVITADDNGGVHINSGIPNHAFYRAATDLGGYAWDVIGYIWLVVLTERLSSKAQFQDFANATVAVAGELYGVGGRVQNAVIAAWADVGIVVPSAPTKELLPVRPVKPATAKRRLNPPTLEVSR